MFTFDKTESLVSSTESITNQFNRMVQVVTPAGALRKDAINIHEHISVPLRSTTRGVEG